jgi:hypothetical protein
VEWSGVERRGGRVPVEFGRNNKETNGTFKGRGGGVQPVVEK